MKRYLAVIAVLGLAACLGFVPWLLAQEKAEPAEVQDADNSHQQLLQTIGILAAGHLYQSYLNIGFIADGKADETYEEKDLLPILASVLALMDSLDKELDKVNKLDASKEHKEKVAECRRLLGLLRKQADELQAFWKTGDKKLGDRYEETRHQAWTWISKLLELKDSPME